MKGDVIYFGHVFNASGYATGSRGVILALHEAGYRVRVAPISQQDDVDGVLSPPTRELLLRLKHTPVAVEQALCIHAHGADTWQIRPQARHLAGRTMFETDGLPPGWAQNCNRVHEVWVPSRFNMETFRRAGVEPSKVYLLPEGVDTSHFRPGVEPLPLPGRPGFTFLSVFDWQFRKGWDVLLRAYLTEFQPHEDVRLVLKVYQYNLPDRDVERDVAEFAARALGRPLEQGPPVVVLRGYIGEEAMPRLYAAADAFVLPTRGEGFGRPLAEAMACGLPTIATNWGGHLDFMRPDNAYLIQCQAPVPVSPQNDIWVFQGQRWAEPDVAHLRSLLRHVYAQRGEAAARGAAARQTIVQEFDLPGVHQRFLHEVQRILG
jgi:glycosyltransferase involved in cell wall biosynthesis